MEGAAGPTVLDVIPAQAGIHFAARASRELDPCLRRDDTRWVWYQQRITTIATANPITAVTASVRLSTAR
jgi:hypothetical protein